MRDRLIELIEPYSCGYTSCLKSIADQLLANGWILPPCKRGDKIYCIRKDKYGTPFVKELEVRSVTVYGIDRFTVYTTKDDAWGQTAFATFEEAEKALKENN
jgi:hypothetical protein